MSRVGYLVAGFVFIGAVTYLIVPASLPDGWIEQHAGCADCGPDWEEREEELRLSQPWVEPSVDGFTGWLAGDLGTSELNMLDVRESVRTRGVTSAQHLLLTLGLSAMIALFVGVAVPHRVVESATRVCVSVPVFAAVLPMILFLVDTERDGQGRLNDDWSQFARWFGWHAEWRVIMLTVFFVAPPLVRAASRRHHENLSSGLVVGARGTGRSSARMWWSGPVKMTALDLIPISTRVVPSLVSVYFIVELSANLPGITGLLLQSTFRRDYAVTIGVVFAVTAFVFLLQVVGDLVHSLADPRVRNSASGVRNRESFAFRFRRTAVLGPFGNIA